MTDGPRPMMRWPAPEEASNGELADALRELETILAGAYSSAVSYYAPLCAAAADRLETAPATSPPEPPRSPVCGRTPPPPRTGMHGLCDRPAGHRGECTWQMARWRTVAAEHDRAVTVADKARADRGRAEQRARVAEQRVRELEDARLRNRVKRAVAKVTGKRKTKPRKRR